MNHKKTDETPVTSRQQGEAIDWHSTVDTGYEQRIRQAIAAYFNRRQPTKGHSLPVSGRTPTGRMDRVGLDDNRQAVSTSAGPVEGGQAVGPEVSTPLEQTCRAPQKPDNPPRELSGVNHNTKHTIFMRTSESSLSPKPALTPDSEMQAP